MIQHAVEGTKSFESRRRSWTPDSQAGFVFHTARVVLRLHENCFGRAIGGRESAKSIKCWTTVKRAVGRDAIGADCDGVAVVVVVEGGKGGGADKAAKEKGVNIQETREMRVSM